MLTVTRINRPINLRINQEMNNVNHLLVAFAFIALSHIKWMHHQQ